MTELDLSAIEPLVACPSNPDNVKRAAELGHVDVHQVILGSSCNGSFRDFMIAAMIVEGRQRHPQVDFEINTGSRQTLVNVMNAGGTRSFVEAGGRIHESGCLGYIGMGQTPASGTVSLRTFPRNFKDRSGTKGEQVYLCSPETAAASVLTGKITDPRTLGPYPDISLPTQYYSLVFADPADYDIINQGDSIILPNVRQAIAQGATVITIKVNSRSLPANLEVSERQRQVLLAGSILNPGQRNMAVYCFDPRLSPMEERP